MKKVTSNYSLSTFEPLVEQVFQAAVDGKTWEFQLVQAKPLRAFPDTPRQDPFLLLFRAPKSCDLGQGSLQMDHDQLGTINLFVVPVKSDEEGVYFESIFN